MKPTKPSLLQITITGLLLLVFSGYQAIAQQPTITVRFNNPEYVCSTRTYNVDVEFQSNPGGYQVFAVENRFYYPDNVLEFLSIGEYAQGYGQYGSITKSTGNANSGTSMFSFPGPSEYVYVKVIRTTTSPVFLSSTGWTKLYNMNFTVDDSTAFNIDSFCPSIIWDLEENPADGGFAPGSGGVTITVASGTGSAPSLENVVQFNWQYDGIPGTPYGFPVATSCLNTICAYAPHTILPTCGSGGSGTLDIPVTVVDFDNVGILSLVFEYDPAVMTYVSNTPNAIFTATNGLLNVSDSLSTGGNRKIKMYFHGVHPISLADSSHITELHFNYNSESTDLSWLSSGNLCRYADSNHVHLHDLPHSEYYLNGEVSGASNAPITKIDSSVAVTGDFVTFTVRTWDFTNIHSGLLTLNYDPGVLAYQETVPNIVLADNFTAQVISSGTLEMQWTGSDTSLTDGSALMYVTYQYMGGTAPLTWFDDGLSCHYTKINVPTPLADIPAEDFYITGNVASAVYTWTGETSGDWNSGSNWMGDTIPSNLIDVIIDANSNPANWPIFNGNFTIGEDCKSLTLVNNALFTVNGDLTVNPGHSLILNGPAVLQVSGSWNNSGTFIPGTGTVEFTGSGNVAIAEGEPAGNFIANYIRSTFTAGMIPITGGTAGPTGDDAHSNVNIGFNFNYLGINYSQARINTNGWLSLNLTGEDLVSSDNTLLFNNSAPYTVLAPWWDDLKADASTAISYKLEGSSPSRTFIAEWKNILAYSSGATARLNFQVKLYETSNIIEFCYGSATSGTHNTAEGASIGIKDATGGSGNFIEATQNSNELIIAFLKSNSEWPPSNYRFSPPAANEMEEFFKIVVSKPGGNLQIQRDVKITGIN